MIEPVVIGSVAKDFKRLYAANVTASAFATPNDSATKPAAAAGNNNVLDTRGGLGASGPAANSYLVRLDGVGSNNQTAKCRVHVWTWCPGTDDADGVWVRLTLAEITATFGTPVGVAGTVIPATSRIADTYALTFDSALQGVSVRVTTMSDSPAAFVVDSLGGQLVEIELIRVTMTSVNGVVRPL